MNDPGERTYYTWDHRNRLIHVSQKSGDHEVLIVDYGYDAFNQLVYQRTDKPFENGENTTVFVHDNGQVAMELHQTGAGNLDAEDLAHRYLWGPVVDQLFADEQVDWSDSDADGEVLWAMTDHLGSVRDVVDSNGKWRIHRQFDAFGKIVDEIHLNANGSIVTAGQAGFVDVAFAFTGRYLDPDTGLQNNLNRWYDPTTGRWLSEDPISFAAGDPNLYRYVGNMPTNSTDPFGLTTVALPMPIGGPAAAAAPAVAVGAVGAVCVYGAHKAAPYTTAPAADWLVTTYYHFAYGDPSRPGNRPNYRPTNAPSN